MSDKPVRGKRTVTIVDVAEKAGVSVATASRALSGRGYASAEVKERVRQASRQLNYRLNAAARTLKVNRTHTIGLIITDIINPFYAYLADGVLNCARQLGYQVVLCATEEDPEMEREAIKVLLEQRVDGIIAVPTGKSNRMWREVLDMETRLVLVDREIPGLPQTDLVLVDNVKGAYLATKYLLELGHRRIGLIRGPIETTTGRERVQGYVEAYREAGITIDSDLIQGDTFFRESGYSAMNKLLSLPQCPTAVFATNNVLGEAAILSIREHGLHIPQDISFLMFDDVSWAVLFEPAITVVRQPTNSLGIMSLKLLDQRLKEAEMEEAHPPVRAVLEPEIIKRSSCLPLSIAEATDSSPMIYPSSQTDKSQINPLV